MIFPFIADNAFNLSNIATVSGSAQDLLLSAARECAVLDFKRGRYGSYIEFGFGDAEIILAHISKSTKFKKSNRGFYSKLFEIITTSSRMRLQLNPETDVCFSESDPILL